MKTYFACVIPVTSTSPKKLELVIVDYICVVVSMCNNVCNGSLNLCFQFSFVIFCVYVIGSIMNIGND